MIDSFFLVRAGRGSIASAQEDGSLSSSPVLSSSPNLDSSVNTNSNVKGDLIYEALKKFSSNRDEAPTSTHIIICPGSSRTLTEEPFGERLKLQLVETAVAKNVSPNLP